MGFIYEQCISLQPRNLQLSLELLTNHKARRCQLGLGKAPSPGPVARSAGGERGGGGGWPWEATGLLAPACHRKAKQPKQGADRSKTLVKTRQWGSGDAHHHHHSGRERCGKWGHLTGGLERARVCRHHSIQRKVPQTGFVGHVPAMAWTDQTSAAGGRQGCG